MLAWLVLLPFSPGAALWPWAVGGCLAGLLLVLGWTAMTARGLPLLLIRRGLGAVLAQTLPASVWIGAVSIALAGLLVACLLPGRLLAAKIASGVALLVGIKMALNCAGDVLPSREQGTAH